LEIKGGGGREREREREGERKRETGVSERFQGIREEKRGRRTK